MVRAYRFSSLCLLVIFLSGSIISSQALAVQLRVLTKNLPDGFKNESYSQQLKATGGGEPRIWALIKGKGELPDGLTLSPDGKISGKIISSSKMFKFEVGVKGPGALVDSATQDLSIFIDKHLKITTVALPDGVDQLPYKTQVLAAGGESSSYSWSVIAGSLPEGLTLDARQGIISGTPKVSAKSQFMIEVGDSLQKRNKEFEININLAKGQIDKTLFGLNPVASVPYPFVSFTGRRTWGSTVQWPNIETRQGKYDFSVLDSFVRLAKTNDPKKGQRIEYTFGFVPTFYSSYPDLPLCQGNAGYGCCYGPSVGDCAYPDPAPNKCGLGTNDPYKCWKNFVKALVGRYKSVGVQDGCGESDPQCNGIIEAYELWNEPHNPFYWYWPKGKPGDKTSPGTTVGRLIDMHNIAINIIKQSDPNAVVLAPSGNYTTSLWPIKIGDNQPIPFMDYYYSQKGPKDVDAIALHIYEHPLQGNIPEYIPAKITAVNLILDKYSINKPLWGTEGSWGPDSTQNFTDPGEQAGFVSRYYFMNYASGVERFYWFQWGNGIGTLWNPSGTDGCNAQRGCLAAGGVAYQITHDWMTGATMPNSCSQNGTTFTCSLFRPGGYEALAVWDTSQSCSQDSHGDHCTTIPFQVGAPYTQYKDLLGNVIPIQGATVPIGYRPILIENAN